MMNNVSDTFKDMFQFLNSICAQGVNGVICVEPWLREELTRFGVTAFVQTIVLLALTAVLIWGTFNRFGGVVRAVVVPVLLLIAVQIVQPTLYQIVQPAL
jgi:hypothetical protein